MRARKPNNFLILTLLGSVLYGGCVLPGDDSGLTPPPCDCPNLEAAVDSINWVSGLGVSTIEMSRGPEGLAIQYVWDVNLGDPSVDLVELREALIRTGFHGRGTVGFSDHGEAGPLGDLGWNKRTGRGSPCLDIRSRHVSG